MLRRLLVAVLLVPSAMAQEPADVTVPPQDVANDVEQFTFEIRFISAAKQVIDQIPKECLAEVSKPMAKEPFEDWDQDQVFERTGTDTVIIGHLTWQSRPIENTRVALLDDDQMIRLIQSLGFGTSKAENPARWLQKTSSRAAASNVDRDYGASNVRGRFEGIKQKRLEVIALRMLQKIRDVFASLFVHLPADSNMSRLS